MFPLISGMLCVEKKVKKIIAILNRVWLETKQKLIKNLLEGRWKLIKPFLAEGTSSYIGSSELVPDMSLAGPPTPKPEKDWSFHSVCTEVTPSNFVDAIKLK